MVESSIRYIPIYPDDPQVTFNEDFLRKSQNVLPDILPEHKKLADTIKVIDIPQSTEGLFLHVFMNAEQNKAIRVLSDSFVSNEGPLDNEEKPGKLPIVPVTIKKGEDECWRRRLDMAETIAKEINPKKFGI